MISVAHLAPNALSFNDDDDDVLALGFSSKSTTVIMFFYMERKIIKKPRPKLTSLTYRYITISHVKLNAFTKYSSILI